MKKQNLVLSLIVACLLTVGFTMTASAQDHSAKPESTVPWEYPLNIKPMLVPMSVNNPLIADISKWQGDIDWSKAGKALDLVIIRTQDGINTEDYMHKNYETNANKYNLPYGVYSFVRAGTPAQARIEARKFYSRAGKNTQFYVLDVEVKTNKNGYSMRSVIEAYENEMRKLTNKKVGLYVANHLYSSFNLKTSDFDFVWIPRYSSTAPVHKHDLWQYTSRGSVPGIKGNVDLNYLANGVKLEFFTNKLSQVSNKPAPSTKKYYLDNPKYVILKKKVNVYTKKDFNKGQKKSSYKAGKVVKIKKITKSSAGIPHLELTSGKFITASKEYVLKTSAATYTNFYTAEDRVKQIITLTDLKSYTSASYTSQSIGKFIPKYTILNVSRVAYSGKGEIRFQILNGRFITADRALVIEAPQTIENYYLEEEGNLQTVKDIYEYTDTIFGTATDKIAVPIGTNLIITGVVFNKLGYPRFQLANGNYISTKKTLFKKIPWYEQE
ncbi:DUF5776 domain-containing protein [Kurthia sibirica]|nr:DUF5776 domain-containing protein [Kurthia sibirica]GEK33427.1 hypothetical protein KSI01_09600 [Kurthia sibirica]